MKFLSLSIFRQARNTLCTVFLMRFWHLPLAMIRNKRFRDWRRWTRKTYLRSCNFKYTRKRLNTRPRPWYCPSCIDFHLTCLPDLSYFTGVLCWVQSDICCDKTNFEIKMKTFLVSSYEIQKWSLTNLLPYELISNKYYQVFLEADFCFSVPW